MSNEQRKELCRQIIKGIEDILCGFRELSEIDNSEDDKDMQNPVICEEEKENVQIEIIRGVMVEKSREGKSAQVRDLLKLFNAERLSDVDEAYYDELLKMAQSL